MITNKQTIVKIDANDLKGKGRLIIQSKEKISSAQFIVADAEGKACTFSFSVGSNILSEPFEIENAKLWSVDSPYLYRYTLTLGYADGEEKVEGRFGFRTLSHDKHNVLLNDKLFFVRGYIRGATAHEHPNLTDLSEEEYYRKNIRNAKSYGFNFVRFHSVVPNETFFKVADEEGILVHLELRMEGDEYNNLEEMLYSRKDLIPNEFILKVIDRVYNHPSLAVYCIGNEIKNLTEGTRVEEIGALIKTTDPSRLYLDTCAWGENGRPYVDIDVQHMGYYFPYGKHGDMFSGTENMLVVGNDRYPLVMEGENAQAVKRLQFNVPLIAHEVCHYTALRDFVALREKFQKYGKEEPWWVEEELKMIAEKGMTELYPEMREASKHFQKICWKTAFEGMRASPLLGGFHFLQFADTERYENSNGVVDCFDDPTTKQADFLRFNGNDVLLVKLRGRLFYEDEKLTLPVSISSFSEEKPDYTDLYYSLEGKKTYCEGKLTHICVKDRGVYEICTLKMQLSKVEASEKLTLKLVLKDGEKVFTENEWDIWVYAKAPKISYQEFVNYAKENVVISENIEDALAALNVGKKVCLVYRQEYTRHLLRKDMVPPKYSFRATWNRFKPVIWDRGTNYGGLCDDRLNTYGFATDKLYDFNYSVITEDCDKIILDDFPVKPKVLLRGVDKNVRDRFDAYKVSFNLPELMYDRMMRDFGYLFELKVGKGYLLVCGLNMTGLDNSEPSTVAMANTILQYLHSTEFAPTAEISLAELQGYMQKCAEKPVKERMMTQYWELDDAPVESKQYWEESRAYLTKE